MPFDGGRTSDFDVAIVGKGHLGALKAAGAQLRAGGTRSGPLNSKELKVLGLDKLQQQLSRDAGRPVNFMIYASEDALKERGQPYRPFQ